MEAVGGTVGGDGSGKRRGFEAMEAGEETD
jgi:hypothetical protein